MPSRQGLAGGEKVERNSQLNLSLGDGRKTNRDNQNKKRLGLQNFIGILLVPMIAATARRNYEKALKSRLRMLALLRRFRH